MSQFPSADAAAPVRPSLTIGLLFILTAITAWAALSHSKRHYFGMVMPGDPGPFFIAHLAIAGILLCGLVLGAIGLCKGRAALARPDLRRWGQPALYVATLLAMPLAMATIGTPFAVALFAFPWIVALARRAGCGLMPAALMAAGGALAAAGFTYGVFIRLLTLPLPL